MKEYTIRAPYFSGFYGCEIFTELDDLTGFPENNPELFEQLEKRGLVCDFRDKLDDLIDWQTTRENISKQIVDDIYCYAFSDYVESVEYSSLWSPKYYNYSTDEIYLKITLTDEQLFKIEQFCFGEHRGEFDDHLREHYTSGSGFISFIPNNVSEFLEEYSDHKYSDDDKYETFLGVLFEFLYPFEGKEELVFPQHCDSQWEALTWLRDFDEEEIAKQLIEEYEHEPKN